MSSKVTLPFFPLGIVAFPGEVVKLHIFEPRYRQLFNELKEEGGSFVIVPHVDSRLQTIGTELFLENIDKVYSSGEMDVTTKGVGLVEIKTFQEIIAGKLYSGGEIKRKSIFLVSDNLHLAETLRDRCKDLLLALGTDLVLPASTTPGLSFLLGHRVGLSVKAEYHLLTLATEEERQVYLLAQLEKSIEMAKGTIEMKRRIQMNGHFRYLRSES